MKVIIAGSRSLNPDGIADLLWGLISISLDNLKAEPPTEIVSGGARGADKFGEAYAKSNNIPVKQFLPDWNNYGKAAGFARNQQMADYADALIVLWDGKSRGTAHMMNCMKKLGKPVEVIYI